MSDLERKADATGEFLRFKLESPADTEYLTIRMAKVHIADVARRIGGRKCISNLAATHC